MAEQNTQWGRYHDILYLYVATALADGPMNVVEREQLFMNMRRWNPNLPRATYLQMLNDVVDRMQKPQGGVKLLQSVEKCASSLARRMEGKPDLALRLVEYMRDLAQIDGGLQQMEVILLSTVFNRVNLSETHTLTFRNKLAYIEPIEQSQPSA